MENQNSPATKKSIFAGFLEYHPVVNWILTIAVAVGMFVISARDTQTVQAQDARDNARQIAVLQEVVKGNKIEREKQFDDLKKTVVTREVFDERTNTILKQIELLRTEMQQERDYNQRVLQNR